MEEQPTNTFPTLREVQKIEKAHEDFSTALQEHIFPAPKPYAEEEEVKQTTRFDRVSTMIAKARMESTIGAL
tara:strand:+ start:244 stop:459 length:216 start_codon:yes stop_codon:yes gene_type:complete